VVSLPVRTSVPPSGVRFTVGVMYETVCAQAAAGTLASRAAASAKHSTSPLPFKSDRDRLTKFMRAPHRLL